MTSATTPKTILLKGDVTAKEAVSAGDILPGDLISLDSAGKVARAAAATARAARIAREPEMIGGSIADAYEADDTVPFYIGHKGSEFYLTLATSQTIEIGDLLESAGSGQVRKLAAGVPIFTALEAVTTTGATARIKAEVL